MPHCLNFSVLTDTVISLEERVEIDAQAQWLRYAPSEELSGAQVQALVDARAYRDAKRPELALNIVETLDGSASIHPEILSLKAELYVNTRQYDEAANALRYLERVSPLDATPSLRLGELLEAQFPSNLEPIWAAYHRATKKEPTRADQIKKRC